MSPMVHCSTPARERAKRALRHPAFGHLVGRRPFRALRLLALVALLSSCGPKEPSVEARAGKDWVPAPFTFDRIEGAREGERTRASFFFTGPDSSWLELRVGVEVNPEVTLRLGRWYLEERSKETTGGVRADRLRFLGGQGEQPSIGGTFVLREGGEERFRVSLPPMQIRPPSR